VTFKVFVSPAPKQGEVVVLTSELPELAHGVPMNDVPNANGRLWMVTVQINTAQLQGALPAGADMAGFYNASYVGGMGNLRSPPPHLFNVKYLIRTADGQGVKMEESFTAEPAPLASLYYHRARFPDTDADDGVAFTAFMTDEVHALQYNRINTR